MSARFNLAVKRFLVFRAIFVIRYRLSQKWRTNGVEEITVNVRKMLKKFYWTYLLI
jgi:hypothetical protein